MLEDFARVMCFCRSGGSVLGGRNLFEVLCALLRLGCVYTRSQNEVSGAPFEVGTF